MRLQKWDPKNRPNDTPKIFNMRLQTYIYGGGSAGKATGFKDWPAPVPHKAPPLETFEKVTWGTGYMFLLANEGGGETLNPVGGDYYVLIILLNIIKPD